MKVIILAAGVGSRLKPLTENIPKSLLKINKDTTVLERTIDIINKNCDVDIVVVTGYLNRKIDNIIENYSNCVSIYNPFYRVTNSIASLWFAKEYLDDDIIIINADVIFEEKLFQYVLELNNDASVLYDSSIGVEADYKVSEKDGKVTVMSKELNCFSGEYVGITKLNKIQAKSLKKKVIQMVESERFNEWYENALVDMIFNDNFNLSAIDVREFSWTEIDNVNDLVKARSIISYDNYCDKL